MSNFTGMDTAAVRSLATQMDTSASSIQEIVNNLTNSLQSTQWVGADREQFLGEWQGTHVAQLRNVISGLNDAAGKARRNADQQDQASAS